VTLLSAPLEVGFDYTRSLGPVLSAFMTGLAERRILGVRGSDGRVHVPPIEYDPQPLTELVEVGSEGTVVSWSRVPEQSFAWALIKLDGADTSILHTVDANPVSTGMRVRVRWAASRGNGIRDIEYFEPVAGPVTVITTPVHLTVEHTVSPGEDVYLRGLAEGRVIGQRCPLCRKVYVPPRGACPTCGVPTADNIELPDHGIVTTFCIVNVPFLGQRIKPPYVAAYILLDGADIAFLHLVLGCAPEEVRMGMRVRASWRPEESWGRQVDHFEPTGEPDAPFESYAHHL
jgi:uncharacterized OB-fold protein